MSFLAHFITSELVNHPQLSDEAISVLSVYSEVTDLEPGRDEEEILKTYSVYLSLKSIKALSVNLDPRSVSMYVYVRQIHGTSE